MEEIEADILPYTAFPQAHWRKFRSTIPRATEPRDRPTLLSVAGIFPNRQTLTRLIEVALAE